jgi:primosomal protein N'
MVSKQYVRAVSSVSLSEAKKGLKSRIKSDSISGSMSGSMSEDTANSVADSKAISELTEKEKKLWDWVGSLAEEPTAEELRKKSRAQGDLGVLNRLIKKGWLEIWEQPEIKSKEAKETWWDWKDEEAKVKAAAFVPSEREYKWERALKTVQEQDLPARHQDLRYWRMLGHRSFDH